MTETDNTLKSNWRKLIMSSNLKIPKTCIFCNTRFVARTLTTKYCSHDCNQRHYKVIKKAEKMQVNLITPSSEQPAINAELTSLANTETNNETYLSIEETALLLGVSPRTIMRQIQKGNIRHVKIGRRTIIARTTIANLFK